MTNNELHPGNGQKKRTRFDDDPITLELLLRRVTTQSGYFRPRSGSAPPVMDVLRAVPSREEFFSDVSPGWSTGEKNDDNSDPTGSREVDVALDVFQAVVDELARMAEKQGNIREMFAEVVEELAEAAAESKDDTDQDDVEDTDTGNDQHVKTIGVHDDGDDDDDGFRRFSIDSIASSATNKTGRTDAAGERDESLSVSISRSSTDDILDANACEEMDMEVEKPENEVLDSCSAIGTPSDHHESETQPKPTQGEFIFPILRPSIVDSKTSTKTTLNMNVDTSRDLPGRRRSETHAEFGKLTKDMQPVPPRRSSMTDMFETKVKLPKLIRKANPAGCAISACSVRAAKSPNLHIVCEDLEAGQERYPAFQCTGPRKTAQTVCSDSGIFQMVWEEPQSQVLSGNIELVDLLSIGDNNATAKDDVTVTQASSPMERVKTKLAAWSWARERGITPEDGEFRWIPLLSFEQDSFPHISTDHSPRTEDPPAPPNTKNASVASSARNSAPQSPPSGPTAPDIHDDEDDRPLELKIPAIRSSRPPTHSPLTTIFHDYLSVPIISRPPSTPPSPSEPRPPATVPRQLSNLAAEDSHFKSHRDSVELLRRREQHEEKFNQQLMNSRDSMILTRSKFDSRYPHGGLDLRDSMASRWNRSGGGLSTILDASPPNPQPMSGLLERESTLQRGVEKKKDTGAKLKEKTPKDDHTDCPIYEVERPRWFVADRNKHTSTRATSQETCQ